MLEFLLQPEVYSTSSYNSLLEMLESMWIKKHIAGDGHIYIISGYANFNGGVHFYSFFKEHIKKGGKVTAIFSASSNVRLSSTQVIEELLQCGVDVHIVRRKHLLHAKCYGLSDSSGQQLVITSGNFTGTGMMLNGEAALLADNSELTKISFSWKTLISNLLKMNWDIYNLKQEDITKKLNKAWKLLYNEIGSTEISETSGKTSMVITLDESDTARIQALPGTHIGLFNPYFILGNDSYDFFPPLNSHDNKYSCIVQVVFIDIGVTSDCRVIYDEYSPYRFRLETGALRFSKIAYENDLAVLSRISINKYQLRIIKFGSSLYSPFISYANIKQNNKYYGYIPNDKVVKMLNVNPSATLFYD